MVVVAIWRLAGLITRRMRRHWQAATAGSRKKSTGRGKPDEASVSPLEPLPRPGGNRPRSGMKTPAAAGFVSSDRLGDPVPHRRLGGLRRRGRGRLAALGFGLLAITPRGFSRLRVHQHFPLESVAHGELLRTTWTSDRTLRIGQRRSRS